MSIRYLLSGPDKNKGFQGKIVEYIKEDVKKTHKFVWIAASFDNHAINDSRYNNVIKWFEDIGIVFDTKVCIDDRIIADTMSQNIFDADVIFLSGGDPLSQMKYINEYKLKDAMQKTNAIIFGLSAGSINMADKVVFTKNESEELYETAKYDGIGVTSINIEPHFSLEKEEHNKDLLETSMEYTIIALPNESAIRIENNNYTYINDCYKIENGTIRNI